jgi:hypothetical protein
MPTQTTKSEKGIAGAGYLISFFSDLEVLIGNAANYINGISKLRFKYGKFSEETKMTDIEKSDYVILDIVENFKTSVFKTYAKFSALKTKIKEFESLDKPDPKKKENPPTMAELYKTVRDRPLPDTKDVENYVFRLNVLFVEAVDILEIAQGVYQNLLAGPGGSTHE